MPHTRSKSSVQVNVNEGLKAFLEQWTNPEKTPDTDALISGKKNVFELQEHIYDQAGIARTAYVAESRKRKGDEPSKKASEEAETAWKNFIIAVKATRMPNPVVQIIEDHFHEGKTMPGKYFDLKGEECSKKNCKEIPIPPPNEDIDLSDRREEGTQQPTPPPETSRKRSKGQDNPHGSDINSTEKDGSNATNSSGSDGSNAANSSGNDGSNAANSSGNDGSNAANNEDSSQTSEKDSPAVGSQRGRSTMGNKDGHNGKSRFHVEPQPAGAKEKVVWWRPYRGHCIQVIVKTDTIKPLHANGDPKLNQAREPRVQHYYEFTGRSKVFKTKADWEKYETENSVPLFDKCEGTLDTLPEHPIDFFPRGVLKQRPTGDNHEHTDEWLFGGEKGAECKWYSMNTCLAKWGLQSWNVFMGDFYDEFDAKYGDMKAPAEMLGVEPASEKILRSSTNSADDQKVQQLEEEIKALKEYINNLRIADQNK